MKISDILNIPFAYKLWQLPFYRQKIVKVLNDLQKVPHNIKVLDLGCGPGTNLELFKGYDYTGVDLSSDYVNSISTFPMQRIICSDVNDFLDSDIGKYDFILINSLMHHLNDQETESLLSKLDAKLSDSGRVYIIDLILPEENGAAKLLANYDRGKYARTYNSWREKFTRYMNEIECEAFFLKLFKYNLWKLIYFKGKRRV